jgi:hypothetical protein
MSFQKWPSIGKFSDVYHMASRRQTADVTLRGKIKLHGTNAAIRVENKGQLYGQKRTSDVVVGDDNAGFAQWLSTIAPLNILWDGWIFCGEWAGPGVQSGDAVAQIGSKKFFVFAVGTIGSFEVVENGEKVTRDGIVNIVIEPKLIQQMVDEAFPDQTDIIVLPWYTESITINMMDQDAAQQFITDATKLVDDVVGVEDPFIKETFGVSGPGEGIVYYAIDKPTEWREWMFKVKSEAHTVNKSKNRDHVAPEKPEGMDEFVDMFFTEGRFQQMLDEALGGVADRKKTGDFLKAVMSDVSKESVNELELADFDWKDVSKYGVQKTRLWLFNKADEL